MKPELSNGREMKQQTYQMGEKETIELSNDRTMKQQNYQLIGQRKQNYQMAEKWNNRIIKWWKFETTKLIKS